MDFRERVNRHRAWRQWRDLCRALEQAGAELETIEPLEDSSAMVFTADAALVLAPDIALLLRNDGPRGDLEPFIFRSWFERHGFETESLPSTARLDGGNLVRLHDNSFAVGMKPGSSGRSETYLAKRLALGKGLPNVVPIGLTEKRFLHLDTVLGNLAGRGYLVFQEGFYGGLDAVRKSQIAEREVILIDRTDAESYAANLICVGDVVITGKVSLPLRRQICGLGLWVEELSLTEFYKAGGGAKCLTLPLGGKREEIQ